MALPRLIPHTRIDAIFFKKTQNRFTIELGPKQASPSDSAEGVKSYLPYVFFFYELFFRVKKLTALTVTRLPVSNYIALV